MKLSHHILTLSALALLTVSANAADLRVPQAHPDIQAAVDVALPGDRILIARGVYDEAVRIENRDDITLQGGAGVQVRRILILTSIRVSIRKLTFFEDAADTAQLEFRNSRGGDVRSCTFKNGAVGFLGDESAGLTVTKCRFSAVTGSGLALRKCSSATLQSLTVSGAQFGIFLLESDHGLITDCTLNRSSAILIDTDSATVTGNRFRRGRLSARGVGLVIESNVLGGADVTAIGGGGDAISLNSVRDSSINNNRIKKAANNGIFVGDSGRTGGGNNRISGNRIQRVAGDGLNLSTPGNTIDLNRIKKSGEFDVQDLTGGLNHFGDNRFKTSNIQ